MIHIPFMFKTHSRQIQNRFKKFLENMLGSKHFLTQNVLIPNIFGTKFSLYLSYDSHSIHVQNTFLTDLKQIQRNLGNMFVSKYFLTQNVFGPKYFWSQIAFIPKLWLTKHSCSKHIPDRFKTDSKNFGKYVWIKILFDPKCFGPKYFWNQIPFIPKLWLTKHSCSKHIHNRFKTDGKKFG